MHISIIHGQNVSLQLLTSSQPGLRASRSQYVVFNMIMVQPSNVDMIRGCWAYVGCVDTDEDPLVPSSTAFPTSHRRTELSQLETCIEEALECTLQLWSTMVALLLRRVSYDMSSFLQHVYENHTCTGHHLSDFFALLSLAAESHSLIFI